MVVTLVTVVDSIIKQPLCSGLFEKDTGKKTEEEREEGDRHMEPRRAKRVCRENTEHEYDVIYKKLRKSLKKACIPILHGGEEAHQLAVEKFQRLCEQNLGIKGCIYLSNRALHHWDNVVALLRMPLEIDAVSLFGYILKTFNVLTFDEFSWRIANTDRYEPSGCPFEWDLESVLGACFYRCILYVSVKSARLLLAELTEKQSPYYLGYSLTPVDAALMTDDVRGFRVALNESLPFSWGTGNQTAMSVIAAKWGALRILQNLPKLSAKQKESWKNTLDVNFEPWHEERGYNPLIAACINDRLDVVRWLVLDQKHDIAHSTCHWPPALVRADPQCFRFLLTQPRCHMSTYQGGSWESYAHQWFFEHPVFADLEHIDLCGWDIGDSGCIYIAKRLESRHKNNCCATLDVRDNRRIGSRGWEALIALLRNRRPCFQKLVVGDQVPCEFLNRMVAEAFTHPYDGTPEQARVVFQVPSLYTISSWAFLRILRVCGPEDLDAVHELRQSMPQSVYEHLCQIATFT